MIGGVHVAEQRHIRDILGKQGNRVLPVSYTHLDVYKRQVLFTIGLVLFAFIMIINASLTGLLKKGGNRNDR